MFQTYLARKIWQRLAESALLELTAVKVSNDVGFSSWVRAYRLPQAAAATSAS